MYFSTEPYSTTRPARGVSHYTVEPLLEQGSGRLNEDVLFREANRFGVFDGATSLGADHAPAGLSGGLLAARIAADAFKDGGDDLYRCAETANDRIRAAIQRNGIPSNKRHRFWSTSAAVVQLGRNYFDYCQTGDSLIFVIERSGRYRQLTPDTDHDRETLALWKKTPVQGTATIFDALSDQIRDVRCRMNITYGVLNGEPGAMNFIRHGREPLDGVSDILLFTDGLFMPREDPCGPSDWDTFFDLYRKGGLKTVRDTIRALEEEDPGCRKYPRFKIHDDIAAIAVKELNLKS